MKRIPSFAALVLLIIVLSGFIIIRHDVDDARYIEFGKKFTMLCHFPMGEGTWIGGQWVLTAGHVGRDLARDIRDGRNPLAAIDGNEYPIEKVIVHPHFEHAVNDLALVKLKLKVNGGSPAYLYSASDEMGKIIDLAGRGDVGTGLTGPQRWDKITRGATNKIDSADGRWIWFKFDSPDSPNVTDLEGISGPGDSGGPAFIEKEGKFFLVGISSHQKSEGPRGRYGVTEFYTRVSRHKEWIESVIKSDPN